MEDAPVLAEPASNNSLSEAALVALPAAIPAASNGTAADFFKFEAKAGQQVSVDVLAARLASSMDPVIRLIAVDGTELGYSDDYVGLGADARLQVTIPADGQYAVEVLDSKYAGASPYYIRIGDFPLATTTLPAALQVGEDRAVGFSGTGTKGITGTVNLGNVVHGGNTSWVSGIQYYVRFARALACGPQAIEVEPNNAIDRQPQGLSGGASGVFQRGGDKDSPGYRD